MARMRELTLGVLGGLAVLAGAVAAVHADPAAPRNEASARPSAGEVLRTLQALKAGREPASGAAPWLRMGEVDREKVLLQQRAARGAESPTARQERRDRAQALAKARVVQLRDAAKRAWTTLPEPLRAELRLHAERQATLRRIADVARESSDEGALSSALQLLYVEHERHEAAVAAVLPGGKR